MTNTMVLNLSWDVLGMTPSTPADMTAHAVSVCCSILSQAAVKLYSVSCVLRQAAVKLYGLCSVLNLAALKLYSVWCVPSQATVKKWRTTQAGTETYHRFAVHLKFQLIFSCSETLNCCQVFITSIYIQLGNWIRLMAFVLKSWILQTKVYRRQFWKLRIKHEGLAGPVLEVPTLWFAETYLLTTSAREPRKHTPTYLFSERSCCRLWGPRPMTSLPPKLRTLIPVTWGLRFQYMTESGIQRYI